MTRHSPFTGWQRKTNQYSQYRRVGLGCLNTVIGIQRSRNKIAISFQLCNIYISRQL